MDVSPEIKKETPKRLTLLLSNLIAIRSSVHHWYFYEISPNIIRVLDYIRLKTAPLKLNMYLYSILINNTPKI